jgi:hypothetical protein
MQSSDSTTIDAGDLQTELIRVLANSTAKTLSAPEIAQAVAAGANWHGLLMPIRRAAVALAQAGRLIIYRNGKPVDPGNFKGVYRLGLPRHD